MNRFLKIGLITLVLAGALGGAGCKTKPKNITAIPGSEGRAGTTTELAPTGPIGTTPGGTAGRGNRFAPGDTGANPVDLNPQNTAANLTPPPQTDLPAGDIRNGMREDREMFRGNTVYFDFDKSAVKKGPETTKVLAVAEYLKAHADAKLEIEGHCDERGTEGYNLSLGERRALSVREILLNNGVAAEKVTTVSYGEARPADPGHDEAAWGKNRRSEFVLLLPAGGNVR